jgi:hypothetical protein
MLLFITNDGNKRSLLIGVFFLNDHSKCCKNNRHDQLQFDFLHQPRRRKQEDCFITTFYNTVIFAFMLESICSAEIIIVYISVIFWEVMVYDIRFDLYPNLIILGK